LWGICSVAHENRSLIQRTKHRSTTGKYQAQTTRSTANAKQSYSFFKTPTINHGSNAERGDRNAESQSLPPSSDFCKEVTHKEWLHPAATIYPNGRFAHLHDPDGNSIELWEAAGADLMRPIAQQTSSQAESGSANGDKVSS